MKLLQTEYVTLQMLIFLGTRYLPISANIYLFKFNNTNTRKRCEICSKLTIITPEQRH